MDQITRTMRFNATVDGVHVDDICSGTDPEIVRQLRVALAKKIPGFFFATLKRAVAPGGLHSWSDQRFFQALTDHYNGEHPDAQITCPTEYADFLADCIRLGMAKAVPSA
jgi:hypothetical protein